MITEEELRNASTDPDMLRLSWNTIRKFLLERMPYDIPIAMVNETVTSMHPITRAIRKAGFTNRKVADILGVSTKYLTTVITGSYTGSTDSKKMARRISDVTGIDYNWIAERIGKTL